MNFRQNRITGFLNDIPISKKLILVLLLCVFLPMISLNLIFLGRITDYISERENKNLQISIDRGSGALKDIINNIMLIGHSIAEDKKLYDVLGQKYTNSMEFYENYDLFLRDRLDRFLTINKPIDHLYIYTDNFTIQTGGNYKYLDSSVKNSKWYKELKRSNRQMNLSYFYEEDGSGTERKYLSLFRIMDKVGYNSTNYEQILRIDIRETAIKDILNNEKGYMDMCLLDSSREIVYSSVDENNENVLEGKLSKKKLESLIKKGHYVNNLFGQNLGEWSLLGVVKFDKKSEAISQSQLFVFMLTFVGIIISSFLIWIIMESNNFRIKRLSKHIEKVGDQNFSLLEINEGKDEIGVLIRKFNSMTSKIDTLINEAYKNELQKKDMELEMVKTELKYLQSQMDPHFLFNTLNAIMSVCVKRGYSELTEVIKHLSKILRRLISWKDELVTVNEELSFTEMYLKIEEFRFCDSFKYTINIEEVCRNVKIPKMSIQTLVENACIHGIQKISGIGIVSINVKAKGTDIQVSIKDNGVGFDPNQIEEIYDDCANNISSSEKIGVRSVFKRLMLYYGENAEYRIVNGDEGAEIIFIIKGVFHGE